jgi:hypothetical protein
VSRNNVVQCSIIIPILRWFRRLSGFLSYSPVAFGFGPCRLVLFLRTGRARRVAPLDLLDVGPSAYRSRLTIPSPLLLSLQGYLVSTVAAGPPPQISPTPFLTSTPSCIDAAIGGTVSCPLTLPPSLLLRRSVEIATLSYPSFALPSATEIEASPTITSTSTIHGAPTSPVT